MKTKFFLEGHYRVRLDHIQPKEAKPHNRIHLKFAMLLTEEEMKQAPTNIRKTYALISDQELEMPKAMIATKLKGIDIEIFATPPVSKKVPLIATLTNCILRDILIHRLTKGEIRMFFSVGIAFDRAVWKWCGNQVFMDCFAKFAQSQSAMFDEDPADETLHDDETGSGRDDELDELAADLNDGKSAAAGDPVHGPDPLLSPLHGVQQMAVTRRKKRGSKNGEASPF